MSYTITITQTKEQHKEESGAYCVVGRETISEAEHDELTGDDRKRWEYNPSTRTWSRDKYDYPPKRLAVKTVETKIFEQTVDILDIKSVIQAINQESAQVATPRMVKA
jgi:hypothetical protein